jgi:FkbM family methyltransferase
MIYFSFIGITLNISAEVDKQILKKYLPSNPIIFEAGAYDGGDTLQMSQFWPEATIYAFEPVENLFSILKNTVKNCSNVCCQMLALSTKTGTAKFYLSNVPGALSGSSSLLEPKEHLNFHPMVGFSDGMEVATVNLDDFAQKNTIDHVDFMWLDMQGAELDMLKASPKIFKTIRAIFMEVAYIELYKGCHLYPEVCQWFESQGFKMVYQETTCAAEGNALFVNMRYFSDL